MFLKYCFNMKQLNDQWDTFSITFYGPLCFIFTGYLISGAQFSSGYTWLKKIYHWGSRPTLPSCTKHALKITDTWVSYQK